jgi:Uncharacterized protein conserved in bacteria (DUF2330)
MFTMTRWPALGLLLTLLVPTSTRAFCGFYVASADAPLHNRATNVVLLREGTLTVVAMENDYAGPAEDFAMVVPVPVVLHERDVRTLPREVFDRIDALGAPRLVEYWEQDPCGIPEGTIGLGSLGTIGHGSGYGSGGGLAAPPAVRVEAEFAVGEYDIVILGADEATALEDWLVAHHYHMPPNAAEALRPYVEEGMKFFVARVDVDRVHFEDGAAVLSPLRFHYHTDAFSLPVRLGLLNSAGMQDLVVSILGRHTRFEVANYENVFIPTNLDVADATRAHFGEFYATLFELRSLPAGGQPHRVRSRHAGRRRRLPRRGHRVPVGGDAGRTHRAARGRGDVERGGAARPPQAHQRDALLLRAGDGERGHHDGADASADRDRRDRLRERGPPRRRHRTGVRPLSLERGAPVDLSRPRGRLRERRCRLCLRRRR